MSSFVGRPVEERVEELCGLMVKMQLVFACDRFYKKAHPGRKHLVKFPRKLDARPRNRQVWDPGMHSCLPLIQICTPDPTTLCLP